MKHAIKERKGKSVAFETATTAIVILLLIVTAGAICVGIAFAQSNGANATASVRANQTTQAAQAMQVAETTPQNGQNANDTKVVELVDNENMKVWTDASGDKVPVPRGYVGSQATGENEINTGYVIYEGDVPVTNANVAEAQKTRNQYVWVPVPDVSKMYGTDANGKKWGKLYNFDADRTSSDTDPVTGAYPLNWTEEDGVMSIIVGETHDPTVYTYREPDIIEMDSGDRMDIYEDGNVEVFGVETAHELLIQLEKDFETQINSITKYGGFYIGRYETGNLPRRVPVVQKGNTDISGSSGDYGYNPWYSMYNKQKRLSGNNKNVNIGMISGSAYDRTLMWLIESGDKTKSQVVKDSSDWGNVGSRIPTGSAEYTKANNIYDLAGNVEEWTTEIYNNLRRVVRGIGYYTVWERKYRPKSFNTYSSST